MTTCPHCKTVNNNFYYCKGCGRKIPLGSKHEVRKESSKSDFTEEVIDIIEKELVISDVTIQYFPQSDFISLDEMSKEEGIILFGNEQWQEISHNEQCSCFLREIFCIYLISGIITMLGTGGYILEANFQIKTPFLFYAWSFLLISFIVWFIIPYFSGFSFISLLHSNCSMFTSADENIKNKLKNLIMIFLFSTPYIFIVPFCYSLLKSKFSKNYLPMALSMSEIKYLKKKTENGK